MRAPPLSTPAAFLSDIHGNLPALEAVLTTLDRLEIRAIYAAGDHLLGGTEPLEVWRRLLQRKVRMGRGVSDTALATLSPSEDAAPDAESRARLEVFRQTQEQLGDLVLRQLRGLPEALRIPLIDGRENLMVHGAPGAPTEELSHDLDDDELRERLDDEVADVIVCGASHVAFRRSVDHTEIVNVGSVGMAPEGGHAHFAILRPRMEGLEIVMEHVAY